MPNIYVTADELYPVYSIDEEQGASIYGTPIDLTDEEYADFREAEAKFTAVQLLIKRKVDAHWREVIRLHREARKAAAYQEWQESRRRFNA